MVKCTTVSAGRKAAEAKKRGAAKPQSHKLADVADFFLEQLPKEERAQLQTAVDAAAQRRQPLRVGTLCSGTDSPVPVLEHLQKALGSGLKIEHTFSCEFDSKKQEWIR